MVKIGEKVDFGKLQHICCLHDAEILNEGAFDCPHEFYYTEENDKCIHVKCGKCNKEICFGIWD